MLWQKNSIVKYKTIDYNQSNLQAFKIQNGGQHNNIHKPLTHQQQQLLYN